jgi:hypothetical protein
VALGKLSTLLERFQLDVSDAGGERVALDLVANLVPLAEVPLAANIAATTISVDTPHGHTGAQHRFLDVRSASAAWSRLDRR